MISFVLKGFPYKDQIELFIGLVCVFPTRNIVNFLINLTFLNCNILIQGMIQPVCAESAVKLQSFNFFLVV